MKISQQHTYVYSNFFHEMVVIIQWCFLNEFWTGTQQSKFLQKSWKFHKLINLVLFFTKTNPNAVLQQKFEPGRRSGSIAPLVLLSIMVSEKLSSLTQRRRKHWTTKHPRQGQTLHTRHHKFHLIFSATCLIKTANHTLFNFPNHWNIPDFRNSSFHRLQSFLDFEKLQIVQLVTALGTRFCLHKHASFLNSSALPDILQFGSQTDERNPSIRNAFWSEFLPNFLALFR